MSFPAKYLVTGASSGLGGSVLATLYQNIPDPSQIAAASSRFETGEKLQQAYPGIQFRHLDYNDSKSLVEALQGVERFFFVSSPDVNTEKRNKQHEQVVKASIEAKVGHVYYSSLAFGGYGLESKASVQQAHLVTEKLLENSGLFYTSVREGVYIDAFPVFVFWYPNTTTIYLSGDGPVAFAAREELGEATAQLMLRDPGSLTLENNIALLTGSRTYRLKDVIDAISDATGKRLEIKHVSKEEFPRIMAVEDARDGRGGKSEAFFTSWQSLVESMEKGDAATVDPLMGELLGREPLDALEYVKKLVKDGANKGGYIWHQNY
ncbi:hypothetical protein MGYG_06541 [Nannizzia gypsea CBS 118893]|uniref:NmrA-like domain-containing protein n=1 Tax=Arthroderma gypseum (strain ATCC MYA-4604 / CBS 118893) TaxID=535722 RepID=E4UZL5_ARTGP|nr:hypothetical protein MGYG_06541 [Nannizzia gypsea CBS 118893]EFR03545.1 hypothetical protein MGYG_06541 [Nannizzia gypsea CBS 118893]